MLPGFQTLPLPIVQLSLAAVLKCGQSFRWSIFPLENVSDASSPTDEYRFCLRDRVVCLRQSSDTLFYRSVFPEVLSSPALAALRETETLAWINDYFQLDVDLVKLYDRWDDCDPVFRKFRSRFGGVRMLRQDPWENLVSFVFMQDFSTSAHSLIRIIRFICSSNNNISRITKMVQALCRHFSPPLLSLPDPSPILQLSSTSEAETYHPFPRPSVLASPDVSATLRVLGFGYRAEFIQRTAKMLVDMHGCSPSSDDQPEPCEEWLNTLRSVSTAEAREELLKFIGVGRKVADCVLLMSLDKVHPFHIHYPYQL
jgi:N-glycosylase/DNA lyase